MLTIKPLGTISPVLNSKLVAGSYPPPKIPSKEGNKLLALKTSAVLDSAQVSKSIQGCTFKPRVPPRPQLKVPLPSADSPYQAEAHILVEKPEKVLLPPLPADKSEKQAKIVDHIEDVTTSKQLKARSD